jgi:hypothetical protein
MGERVRQGGCVSNEPPRSFPTLETGLDPEGGAQSLNVLSADVQKLIDRRSRGIGGGLFSLRVQGGRRRKELVNNFPGSDSTRSGGTAVTNANPALTNVLEVVLAQEMLQASLHLFLLSLVVTNVAREHVIGVSRSNLHVGGPTQTTVRNMNGLTSGRLGRICTLAVGTRSPCVVHERRSQARRQVVRFNGGKLIMLTGELGHRWS